MEASILSGPNDS